LTISRLGAAKVFSPTADFREFSLDRLCENIYIHAIEWNNQERAEKRAVSIKGCEKNNE
jgi:hypothetical protein